MGGVMTIKNGQQDYAQLMRFGVLGPLEVRADGEQLKTLAALYDAAALRPVLDRTFPFDETLDALAFVEQGRAKGKVVVSIPLPRS